MKLYERNFQTSKRKLSIKVLAAILISLTLFSCDPSELSVEQTIDSLDEESSQSNPQTFEKKDESFANSVINIDISSDTERLKFVGEFETLRIFGKLADGSIEDLTSQVNWIVRPPYIGRMVTTEPVRFEALAQGQGEIIASFGSKDIVIPMTVITNSISAIIIEVAGIALGSLTQLKAIALFEDGSQVDISNDVTWSSTDSDMVTITQNPTFLTPTLLGNTLITANYEGYTGSQFISVSKSGISSVRLTPFQETGELKGVVQVGKSGKMKLEAIFEDGSIEDYTEHARWTSNSDKITVSMDVGKRGEVKGVMAGATEVTAILGGFSVTAAMLVTSGCRSIDLLPDPNNNNTLEAYDSIDLPLQVTCEFSNGQILDVTDLATFTFNHPTYATIGTMDSEFEDEEGNLVTENRLVLRPFQKSYEAGSNPNNPTLDISLSGVVEIPGFELDFDVRIYDKPITAIQLADVPAEPILCNSGAINPPQIKAMGTYGLGTSATVANITNLVSWESNSSSIVVGNTKNLDKGRLTTIEANRTEIEISLNYTAINGTEFNEVALVSTGPPELLSLDLRFYSTKITDPFVESNTLPGTVYMPLGKKVPYRVYGIMGCGNDIDYSSRSALDFTSPMEIDVIRSDPFYAQVNMITELQEIKVEVTENAKLVETTRAIQPGEREIYEVELSTPLAETTIDGITTYNLKYWLDTDETITNTATAIFTNYDSSDGYTSLNSQDITEADSLDDGKGIHEITTTWSVDDTSIATINAATGLIKPVSEGVIEVYASAFVNYLDGSRTGITMVQNEPITIGIKTPCSDQIGTSASYNLFCYYLGNAGQSCTDVCSTGTVNTLGMEYLYGSAQRSECEAVLSKILDDSISLSTNEPSYALGCVKGANFSYMAFTEDEVDPTLSLPNIRRVCACNP